MNKEDYIKTLDGIQTQLSQFGTDVMEIRRNLYDMLKKLDDIDRSVKKLKK